MPPGSSTPEYFQVYVQCAATNARIYFGGSWVNPPQSLGGGFPNGLTPVSLFLSFDLVAKNMKVEFHGDDYKFPFQTTMTATPMASFDANSKFYLCADKDGASIKACTFSNLVFEYQFYGSPSVPYGHLAGEPKISAFYPLVDGSLAASVGSASSGYFGDKESNPTAATRPTWDSSNNFVTVSSGQFLTFPLPSLSSTLPSVSSSFSIAVWVKITNIPASTTTLFSMYSAGGAQVAYKLVVKKSSNQLSMYFGPQPLPAVTTAPTVTLNQWNLIGFTAYLNTNRKSITGTIFSGTSSSIFDVRNQATALDLSTASVIRIGDASNSFSGQISLVRIMTPGGGIIRTTDLCSSTSSIELGTGPFALACSGSNILSSVDNKCYSSCPSGTREVMSSPSTPTSSLCFSCPKSNCNTCSSSECLTCSPNYLFYQGECVSSCPDKTYSDGSACQSCSDSNCKECDNSKCLTCESSFLLYQGGCVDSCPDKTYSASSACYDCPTNCKVCNDIKCLTCDLNYVFYQENCVDSCPAKFYSDETSCIACSDYCTECNADGCKACENGYELKTDKNCVPKSPTAPTKEEAGASGEGISSGTIAGIVCGSVATVIIAGWFAFRFKKIKSPFGPKSATSKIYPEKKIFSSPEATNLVSPVQTELKFFVL